MIRDRALLGLLAVALVARALWAMCVPFEPVSDSYAYHAFAINLAEHGVFGWKPEQPDAYWAPGAALLYSLAYRFVGVGGSGPIAINLALALVKTALVFSLTERWFGRRAAVAAGLALACWPAQIEFTTVLSSEQPFDVALLGALWIFERGWKSAPPSVDLAVGAALAVASYVRPTALPLAIGFAVIALARGARPLRAARLALVASGLIALAIAPWSARNYEVFGRWVPISANSGSNLWMGNNPAAKGGYMPLPAETRGMSTADRDAYLGREARRWMRDNPGGALLLAARKIGITHSRETIGVAWNARGLSALSEGELLALKAVSTGYWWAALLAGLAGVALRLRARGLGACLSDAPIALWGYFALLHAVTVAQDRYHFASVPFVAALGGLALSTLAGRFSVARSASAPTPESAA